MAKKTRNIMKDLSPDSEIAAVIARNILNENVAHPYSDRELAELCKKAGLKVATGTPRRIRLLMCIPNSDERQALKLAILRE